MVQLLAQILFFVVFLLLLVATALYLIETIGKYVREGKEQRAAKHGIAFSDSASIIAATPDAAIIVNQLGIIVQANRQAALLFGYSELIGQLVDMLLPDHLRTIHQQHRAKYFANQRVRRMGANLSLFGLHANGNVLPVEVSLSPLTVGGEKHTMAIIREKKES
jgi:PAS domain S-box-containing protein